ncbi:MAG TPA: Holliday junction branch migration protein RuvA [Gammaproteobacteria bacterium]|nr:Holliday junction branch migration protein RuvA [Gammaproteobacteria bacterium]
MIGQLFGTLLEKQAPNLLLKVQGVGYEIAAPMSTFYRLPEVGQELILYTHLVVREDAHHLYGFSTRPERSLFRALLKVNGVGPRLALTILSSIEPEEFARCVLNQETVKLVCLPGIGKKTAERLIIEMRDKLKDWSEDLSTATLASSDQPSRNQVLQDAIAALIALGYKPQEASRAVAKVDEGKSSSEEMIRRALQEVSA